MKKVFLLLMTACLAFSCTDNKGEGNKSNATVLNDGFYMLDGFDGASGRYRINVYACTQDMANKSGKYTDVLLWIYSDSDPKVKPDGGDSRIRIMPTGPVTPFFEDGRELPPLVYHIGKTGKDAEGEQNMQGSGWVNFDENGKPVDYFACEKGEHSITYNSTTKMYTITGKMIDETKGEEFEYTFTSDKDLIEMIQD